MTAGESHGKGLAGIISDYPSGIPIDIDFIDHQLARRQKGYGRGGRMSIEKDKIDLISGIRKGRSTGSPISFIIKNRDWENWKDTMDIMPEKGINKKEKNILAICHAAFDSSRIISFTVKTFIIAMIDLVMEIKAR